jgi:HEAT repeat protein
MSQTTPTIEPMAAELSALLAEFARTCKASARAVSLYPATHPAIGVSLSRLVVASARLTNNGRATCSIYPDAIAIAGRTPIKPDPAIGELASLLHERLIGELTIEHDADAEDWRALLLLLARAPEDLIAGGGITHAWNQAGRAHFTIREIDYAEVMRERAGGNRVEWDRIMASCLEGDRGVMDDAAMQALLEAVSSSETFGDLLEHFQRFQAMSGVSVDARAAALLQLMRSALEAVKKNNPDDADRAMQTMADACARLSPEMMLALLDKRHAPDAVDAQMAAAIVDRVNEQCVASFVARSVTTERGASEQLSSALDALAPEAQTKARVLELAYDDARKTEVGQEAGFEDLWKHAANTLTAGATKLHVPEEYDRELTDAGHKALEVERVADDPPERVHAWVDSVSETALHDLDLQLVRDLLRIELDPPAWEPLALIAVGEIEKRVLQNDVSGARALAEAVVAEMQSKARPPLKQVATRVLERLWSGPLVRHVVLLLRKDDSDVESLQHLCHAIGAGLARPLAELLAVEDNARASRHLRELLLSYGPAGRQSVEQLKHSQHPAVRRMAVDMLRVFGGQEALAELATMLDDPDPQVHRESIRAIVQIGTTNAFAVLQRALVAGSASRDTVLQELVEMRDDKVAPLLCYVLRQTEPEGTMYRVHADMVDALGNLKAHADSVRTLQQVLHRGKWWSPFRTSALRRRAALALRRLGTPEAMAVLQEAASGKARGPRRAARAQLQHVSGAEVSTP